MANPRYSVVIAAYNAQSTLPKAISSVQQQTISSWEICAVDDGSTDETGTMLDALAESDERIKVYHQPNAGPGAARRFALSKCTGDCIAFLDADDYYSPDYFEQCEQEFSRDRIDLLFVNRVEEKPDGKIIGRTSLGANRGLAKSLIIRRQMTGVIGWGMGKVFRRDLLGSVRAGFTDLEVGEEALFGFEVVNAANAIGFVDECVYHCLRHEGGQHEKGGENPWLPVVHAMSSHLASVGELKNYMPTINSFALRALCIAVYRASTKEVSIHGASNAVSDLYTKYVDEFDFDHLDLEAMDKASLLILRLLRSRHFWLIVLASRFRKMFRP